MANYFSGLSEQDASTLHRLVDATVVVFAEELKKENYGKAETAFKLTT